MPRRAIFLSVLACFCMAPDAALAAGPVTKRDATPANGTQVDPSAAITSTGRLVAATDDTAGADRVHIWNRVGGGDVPVGTLVPGNPARQPSLAWDGGATAHLATASSSGCGTPAGISTWSYTVAGGGITPTATNLQPVPSNATVSQTWPRTVLGAPGSVIAGRPIVVADQEDCATGDHDVVIAWNGPSHFIDDFTRALAESPVVAHDTPRYPDVAVLGTEGSSTRIIIAYLGEVSGGQQDVRVRECLVGDLSLDCSSSAPVTVDRIAPAGTVTKGGTSLAAIAAPAIACAAGACTVVLTEASGGGRSRVLRSRATANDTTATSTSGYTSWSSATQVAGSSTTGSQLLPSVAVVGSRTDVVYLNLNDNGTVDAFQTSFDGAARGDDISLVDGPAFTPAVSFLGGRTDAVEVPGGPSPVLAGYFPDENGGAGTVSEGELAHGTTLPTLALPGATKTLAKNVGFNASTWLAFDDADGDPATVTVDDPPHGSFVNGVYTPDPSWAGSDTVTVRATYGATVVTSAHPITITNQAPVLDAPAPAIVDEGGATVAVPLHADDPDANDAIVYSVASAEPPLNVPGRVSISGATLHLTIPPGVRAMAPLRITVRARDTTTGLPALDDYQDLSVTIRPDLAVPTTASPAIQVTGSRATLSAGLSWIDPSNDCLKAKPRTICHVRQVWNFGDGTPSVTTTDGDLTTLDHPYAKAGRYSGQVTTWVLWGGSQVASSPKPFTVSISDDGRTVVSMVPSIARKGSTARQVTVRLTAHATGSANVTITYAGKKRIPPVVRRVVLKAGTTTTLIFPRISLRSLKSRRATIKITDFGMLAGSTQPKPVPPRLIILR
jgi:hypothetical protein